MFPFLLLIAVLAAVSNCQHLGEKDGLHQGRIVGGEKTTIELHPHQVSLQTLGFFHTCGGSIISEYYVLTAGHCVKSGLPAIQKWFLKVRAGSSYKSRGGSKHKIDRIIVHEGYGLNSNGAPKNDLALIKVKKPFALDGSRRPIALRRPDEVELPAGGLAEVTGWGTTGKGVFLPDQLRGVAVPIVTKSECEQAYKSIGGIGEGQICAGFYGIGGKDACQGDSGGPLTFNGTLIGIVSYGIGCAQKEYPGVYTEVAYYYDWIAKNAGL